MKNKFVELHLESKKQFEVLDITHEVMKVVGEAGIKEAFVIVQSVHTTAGLRLNHFEPLLMQDMFKAYYRMVPIDINYSHDLFELRSGVTPDERSNGHAHVKAMFANSSESIIIHEGKLMLGAHESILFLDFDGPRKRMVQVQVIGE